jgi:Zn-dependent peptidase ImmA (M78 family)
MGGCAGKIAMANELRQLRDFVPIRPLTSVESFQIAERQASRLLELRGVSQEPVPESVITQLPRIHVEHLVPSPVAGASQWSRGRWLILINGNDPVGRQRFTLAHELKHVLDSRFDHVPLYPADNPASSERIEAICDFFAACLLMPRPWVKRAWREGPRDVRSLACRFKVSRQAMQMRLQQLGLVEPTNRRHEVAA